MRRPGSSSAQRGGGAKPISAPRCSGAWTWRRGRARRAAERRLLFRAVRAAPRDLSSCPPASPDARLAPGKTLSFRVRPIRRHPTTPPSPSCARVDEMVDRDEAGIRRYIWSVTLSAAMIARISRELRLMKVGPLDFLGQVVKRVRDAQQRFLEARLTLDLGVFAIDVSEPAIGLRDRLHLMPMQMPQLGS